MFLFGYTLFWIDLTIPLWLFLIGVAICVFVVKAMSLRLLALAVLFFFFTHHTPWPWWVFLIFWVGLIASIVGQVLGRFFNKNGGGLAFWGAVAAFIAAFVLTLPALATWPAEMGGKNAEPGQPAEITISGKTGQELTVQDAYDSLQKQLDNFNTRQADMETDIFSLQDKLNQPDADMSGLEAEYQDLLLKYGKLKGDIRTLQSLIEDHSSEDVHQPHYINPNK